MTLDYFYGQAGELFAFYRIPKALFQKPQFQTLSTDAKTLYGILLDRMSLSVKNGWLDEQGRVFIIFTIEDVKRALCCADNKATKLLRELEKFGLIERKRRGLGKPSLVYVKNFSAESSKSIFQNRDFHDSGGFKSASQDPAKSRCNKTEENSTEKSETYPFYSEEDDGMSKHEQLEEYFSQSLELDILLRLCPDDEDTIYQIVDALSMAFLAATNRVGLDFNYDSLQLSDYRISCVGTALKLYNQMGEKIYCEALRLIVDAWEGKPDSFRAAVLKGVMYFVEVYHGEFNEERLIRALRSVHPMEIYRTGMDNPAKLPGWKKYVFPIYAAYNGKSRKDALPMKF
mgnify:FL=1